MPFSPLHPSVVKPRPAVAALSGSRALGMGFALMALWPAGQLAAEASRGLLDYLRNPQAAPVLDFAAPDLVLVNGARSPDLVPKAAAPLAAPVAAPVAEPEAAPQVALLAQPEPIPEPVPEPAPLPEPLALQPQEAAPLAAAPPQGVTALPAPALTPQPPEVTLAALPPAAVLAPQAPNLLQGQPVVIPEPGSPEALFGPTPLGKDLVRAVQQLLKDQNCYSGAVDGGFGAGSQGSLDLFYAANPALPRETGATEAAWRALQGEGVAPCKAPYTRPVAAKPATKPAAQASNKPASNKPATSKPAAAAKPAAKPATSMSNLAAEAN